MSLFYFFSSFPYRNSLLFPFIIFFLFFIINVTGQEVARQTTTIATGNTRPDYVLSSPDHQYIYVADYFDHTIIRILSSNSTNKTIIAGQSGIKGTKDGPWRNNNLNGPTYLALDEQNNNILYITETDGLRIRKLDLSTKILSSLSGSGFEGGDDGPSFNAQFRSPWAMSCIGNSLYVTDFTSLRKIDLTIGSNYGRVTTVAGGATGENWGTNDGIGTNVQFRFPQGITKSPDGLFLFIADTGNHRIRKFEIFTGIVTTVVGSSLGYTDGDFGLARFSYPRGITMDPLGQSLYTVENNCIRRISFCGDGSKFVETFAGFCGNNSGLVDGIGTNARFFFPSAISYQSADSLGMPHLLVAENANHAVRRIAAPLIPSSLCPSEITTTTTPTLPISSTSSSSSSRTSTYFPNASTSTVPGPTTTTTSTASPSIPPSNDWYVVISFKGINGNNGAASVPLQWNETIEEFYQRFSISPQSMNGSNFFYSFSSEENAVEFIAFIIGRFDGEHRGSVSAWKFYLDSSNHNHERKPFIFI